MSQENVEIIRRGLDAYVHGGIEAAYDVYTEDCEIIDPPEFPDPLTGRGKEALKAIADRFAEMWEGSR